MPRQLFRPVLLWFILPLSLAAHTIPSLTIEAEFDQARKVTLQVNLDPRLFISPQPSSLPPVPASWWLEMDAASRKLVESQAVSYLDRVLHFTVGAAAVKGDWKVKPIDSSSSFPLSENSAEVHLLVEHQGVLPAVEGEFKVFIGNECAVGVILLTSLTGRPERHPQSLFPGESSRGIKLPALKPSAAVIVEGASSTPSGAAVGDTASRESSWWRGYGSGHFTTDHLIVALLLALLGGGRFWGAFGFVFSFQAAHFLAAAAVLAHWLPEAPGWMKLAGWMAVVAGALGLVSGRASIWRTQACFAVAGLCHGLDLPHLHLGDGGPLLARLTGDVLLLLIEQATVVAAVSMFLRLRQGRRVGTSAA